MSDDRFSVCAFNVDGSHTYLEPRFVRAPEAVRMALSCIESASAQLGLTHRIIITDGGDDTTFEWEHGRGVIFPEIPDG
jgi:hypothetical protein